jgi:hypothetical protein
LTLGALILAGALTSHQATAGDRDSRSLEILDYSCASRNGEQWLTLFGNGTVRLRERSSPDDQWSLRLFELSHDEVAGYRARLQEHAHDREFDGNAGGPSGEWVEQCRIAVLLDEGEQLTYRFAPIESLPLGLSPLLAVADELIGRVREGHRSEKFPVGYRPQRGDVLIGHDGARFRIERFTGDGRGLELVALDSPLVLYVSAESVTADFARLDESPEPE